MLRNRHRRRVWLRQRARCWEHRPFRLSRARRRKRLRRRGESRRRCLRAQFRDAARRSRGSTTCAAICDRWPGCDKSFARSHDCKRHQNLHLNIKPHTCEQCGKTFARLDALNRHHKSDTGGCTTKSDGESQSNETDGSSISGAYDGADSDRGSQNWGQGDAGAAAAPASSGKTFGGHVL